MDKANIKQVLMAIFVGACVSFLTTLFDGMATFLQGYGNNIAGGIASTAVYKSFRV